MHHKRFSFGLPAALATLARLDSQEVNSNTNLPHAKGKTASCFAYASCFVCVAAQRPMRRAMAEPDETCTDRAAKAQSLLDVLHE
jgi:hypothetical protein